MVLANNIEGRGRQLLLPYAIYGAFAFLAMVLEKNDFFVAAGCVLLVAASVMGLYFYKKDQSLVSFRFLLSVFWTAGEGLGVMQLSNLQSSWTNQTWLSFGGFYLLKTGDCIRKQMPDVKKRSHQRAVSKSFILLYTYCITCNICNICF